MLSMFTPLGDKIGCCCAAVVLVEVVVVVVVVAIFVAPVVPVGLWVALVFADDIVELRVLWLVWSDSSRFIGCVFL